MESPMEGEEEELSNFRRQSLTVTNTDEEVRELPVLQRLQFPLIWARLSTGIRIQDLKENQFTDAISVIKLIQGEALEKLMKYQWHIHKKANVFERFNVDDYYRVCLLSILPEYRGLGIGMGFMITAEKMTRLMGLTVLTGIFTNASSQNLASKIGMENVFEVRYIQWLENDEMVFQEPGPGNYSSILMAKKLS
ncbi:uncharacterized protein LOC126336172 isoform X3 [Schistocerca gregaria]|uniref:uncharacterized protein LOC126336172 isoform X3 n=1 Tax=Schistocerca gregaria TaxID=7010 RepID=UPI00211E1E68|nr:uncharacterized protein LOC126336172 isoform X3 [Schistocerca gregaria]